MPKKDTSQLKAAQREADDLKKKVDNLAVQCQKVLEDSTRPNFTKKRDELYKTGQELETALENLTVKTENLNKADEQGKVSDFDGKKRAELKRLQGVQEKLSDLMQKLEPDEVEEDYLRKAKKGLIHAESESQAEETAEEDEGDDEEEEEEEEEGEEEEVEEEEDEEDVDDEEDLDDEELEEEEEEETEEEEEEEGEEEYSDAASGQSTPRVIMYEALSDFVGEQPDDLSFNREDILTLVAIREDGWWECENVNGERGLVPSTYLKEYNRYKEVQTPEVEEDDDEDDDENRASRSGKMLWSSIKKAVKETSATDVLQAMGAVPPGFRPSTLAKYMKESDEYTMQNYLAPKLSHSHVAYKDLFFNPATNKIRSRGARFQKILTLQNCRQIPLPGTDKNSQEKDLGVEILNRCVRVCLFDGQKVLSNIVVVKAFCTDKEQKTWTFNTKLTDLVPSLEYAEFFIRCNINQPNIGILFELSTMYKRTKTNEKSEFSCGWVHLPLFNEDGTPAVNKSYDLEVNGGTPYEKGVEVDPSISRRATSNPLRSLISKNKQPRLVFKLAVPTKEQKEHLDTLPDVLVGNMCSLISISYYRQLLADILIRDKLDMQSTELIHSPFLKTFPAVADQNDVMDVLRSAWTEKLKTAKKADKRDSEHMKELFRQVFLESAYPLYHSITMETHVFGDEEKEQARKAEIDRLTKLHREKKSVLASLLAPDSVHKPFEISELAFDVLGTYCIAKY